MLHINYNALVHLIHHIEKFNVDLYFYVLVQNYYLSVV